MHCVVTGCAGFIGSHLCQQLLADGHTVSGIDSLAPTYDTIGRRLRVERLSKYPGLEFVEGDLNEIDLSPITAEADLFFHLAARPGVRASWSDFEQVARANVQATKRVLDAIASNPRVALVFSSSSSVYGHIDGAPVEETQPLAPISPYGVTKAACEALVTAYTSQFEISAASLRYFTVYGPRQRSDMAFSKWIMNAFLDQPIRVFGDGSAARDFTYVADVVDATIMAGRNASPGHSIYNVAGGNPVSLDTIFELLAELTGKELNLSFEERAPGDPDRTAGSTRRIEQSLGWKPVWDLRDGLKRQVSWVLESRFSKMGQ